MFHILSYPVFKVQDVAFFLTGNDFIIIRQFLQQVFFFNTAWRRPTLPGPCGPSTIGAGGLNGRVRDGNVWFPSAIATKRELLYRRIIDPSKLTTSER